MALGNLPCLCVAQSKLLENQLVQQHLKLHLALQMFGIQTPIPDTSLPEICALKEERKCLFNRIRRTFQSHFVLIIKYY